MVNRFACLMLFFSNETHGLEVFVPLPLDVAEDPEEGHHGVHVRIGLLSLLGPLLALFKIVEPHQLLPGDLGAALLLQPLNDVLGGAAACVSRSARWQGNFGGFTRHGLLTRVLLLVALLVVVDGGVALHLVVLGELLLNGGVDLGKPGKGLINDAVLSKTQLETSLEGIVLLLDLLGGGGVLRGQLLAVA